MHTLHGLAQVGVLSLLLAACAEVDTASDLPQRPPSDADREAAAAAVQQARQALGEASCGSTDSDAVIDAATVPAVDGHIVVSPDAMYDHATCRNAFIVDVVHAKIGTVMSATATAPVTPPWGMFQCLLTWAYVGLWQKQGANYVKIAEQDAWASYLSGPIVGTGCESRVDMTLSQDGDYRVVMGSAFALGPMIPVALWVGGPLNNESPS